MKDLIVFCIVGAAIYSVQGLAREDELKEMRNACIKKTGVAYDRIKEVRGMDELYPDDDKIAAYMRCMLDKLGAMDSDGTIHREVMMKQGHLSEMTDDEAQILVDECIEKQAHAENLDKKAYELFKCFRSGSIANGGVI